MIVTVTLNPTLDKSIFCEEIKEGEKDDTIRVKYFTKDPGGKGIIVSRILNQLSSPVMTVTILGGNVGNAIKNLLRKEGIYPLMIELRHETRENIVKNTINKPDKQEKYSLAGPNVSASEYDKIKKLIISLATTNNILVLAGSLPDGIKLRAYQEIILLAKKANPNIKIILDSDGKPLKYALRERPDYIKPNICEAQRLLNTKKELRSLSDQIWALKKMRELGPEKVVLSRGKDGVIGYDGKEIVEVFPPKIKVVNTVGAGDSMVAAIAFLLESGATFPEILKYAVQVSAANVSSATNICGQKEIDSIKKEDIKVVIHKNF